MALTSLTVEELEAEIATLSKSDQVVWMRFLAGVPHKPTRYHPLERVEDTTEIIWTHVHSNNVWRTDLDVALRDNLLNGHWEVIVGPWDFVPPSYRSGWYNSRPVDTVNGVARAVIRGIRKYFKAVR